MSTNYPPENADPLYDRLTEQYAAMVTRADELEQALARVPDTLDDEAMVERGTSFVKQVKAHAKLLETTRVGEKEPYLESSRKIDAFFKRQTTRMEKIAAAVEKRIQVFLVAKEAAERQRRLEEQRRADEAARLAAEKAAERESELAAQATDDDLDAAIAADQAARQAQAEAERARRAAEAKAAELARTRGSFGGVATLRTRWVGEMTDRSTLDLEALRPHLSEDALNMAIRSFVKAGGRKLRGANIREDRSAMVA